MSLCVPTYTTIPDFPTESLRNVNFHALINTLLVYPPAIRVNWWNCFSPGSWCCTLCSKAQSLSAPGALSLNNTVVTLGGAPRKADKLATASINGAYLKCPGPGLRSTLLSSASSAYNYTQRRDQKWTTVLWIHFCPFLCYQKTYQTQIKC